MPVRSRRPEDDKPLFRAVNEQRLMGPVSGSTEAAQNGAATREEPRSAETTSQAASGGGTAGQAEKGPVSRALDRAQENNWVYPGMANAARDSGLVNKLDELVSRLSGR